VGFEVHRCLCIIDAGKRLYFYAHNLRHLFGYFPVAGMLSLILFGDVASTEGQAL
jgi:hypothetical protein